MKMPARIVSFAAVLALGMAAGALIVLSVRAPRPAPGASQPAAASAPAAARYHCPMHPTMVSDKPGDCPICGMRMVPMEEPPQRTAAGGGPAPPRRKVIYRSTMNPSEVSNVPGKDSMGMEMERVEVEEPAPGAAKPVEGLASVRLTDRKRQLIGVRTSTVTREPFVRSIRTVGRVVYDETRLSHLHTKVGGWIESLLVNATGETVTKGQPLLTIYSPELLAAAQDYLLALRARDRMAGATEPSLAGAGQDLVASARRRLQLLDLTDAQIAALESSGRAPRTMTLYAPAGGVVLARDVQAGERIEPGTTLMEIADPERVWVLADIYEYEMPFVRAGQKAIVTLASQPGRTFQGRITLIYPTLDAATRTAKARVEVAGAGRDLKPDMYADVALEADLGPRLSVPESAVLGTGTRDIVFVDEGDGWFAPREVKLGLRLPERVEVLDGLSEGEKVLTSGNFFIDSESKLKSALEGARP